MTEIRVMIADDHPLVRGGIREVLREAGGISVVGEATSGEEALRLAQELQPEVLVLDMQLPDMTGVEVLRRLREGRLPVRVLGLSSHDDREYIQAMLLLGTAGYLIKDEAAAEIAEAVRGVARGEIGWVSRSVAIKMEEIVRNEGESRWGLKPREIDILRYIVEGKTNGEIALQMKLSEKTIEKILTGVFTKLGVNSRVDAAVLAVRESMV